MTDLQCGIISTIAAVGIACAIGWLRGRAWCEAMELRAERQGKLDEQGAE
jgi:hypothetical protein